MSDLREKLNRETVLRIVLALCVLAIVAVLAIRIVGPKNPYSFERLTEDVTLVCRETGEEFKMPRGRMEQMLWDRPGTLDAAEGLINPTTGRPTLFPKSEWEQTIERINSDRQAVAGRSRSDSPAHDE
jgi:hypothetical protein